MLNNFFFLKSGRLWDNVEKYGTAGQDADDNIIRRMRFACWITKATDTHPEYVIIFHGKNGYLNLPQCYVYLKPTLPVLLYICMAQYVLATPPPRQIPRTEILKIVIGCDTIQGCESLYCIMYIYVA
jgi:hypothetical protein